MKKTVWEYSLETESLRVLHAAHQMIVGFYRLNNFYVLPFEENKKFPSQVVSFPDFPYHNVPRFWEKAKRIDIKTLPIKANKGVVFDIKNLLQNNKFNNPKYKETQKFWEKAEKQILSEIWKIMPDKKKGLKKIVVYPTRLGTSCSFSYEAGNDKTIYIYLREDQGEENQIDWTHEEPTSGKDIGEGEHAGPYG